MHEQSAPSAVSAAPDPAVGNEPGSDADERLRSDVTIGVVAGYEGLGMPQPHVNKLLPTLVRHGYKVKFIGWDRSKRWPKRSTHDDVEYEMILRGGGYASKKLVLWLPLWYLVAGLRLMFRRLDQCDLLMGISFEGSLPIAIATLVRRTPFIYNCRDNMALRSTYPSALRPFITRLDNWMMRRADAVIFPDENRVPSLDPPINAVIVRNCAPEVPIDREPDPSKLTVYAMGYLREGRGVGLLLDAAAEVDGCRVIAAGHCPEKALADRLEKAPNVDFRGMLPPEEALAVCGEADLVFTFYAPDSEINRLAVSNKWSDAMMAARPILLNEEVEKAAWVEEEGIGYTCTYDKDSLVKVLEHVQANRSESNARGARGRVLWEQGYSWNVMEQRIISLLDDITIRATDRT